MPTDPRPCFNPAALASLGNALVSSSLNGHAPDLPIDSSRNLAPADWILPLLAEFP
jgi:hypothetical protein